MKKIYFFVLLLISIIHLEGMVTYPASCTKITDKTSKNEVKKGAQPSNFKAHPLPLNPFLPPTNIGSCLSLNGLQYGEMPDNSAFQPTGGEFSYEAWINIDPTMTSTGTLLFNLPNWSAKGYEYKIVYDSQAAKYWVYAHMWINGTELSMGSSALMSSGVWNHVCIVWSNSSHTLKIYINGALAANTAAANATYMSTGYGPEFGRCYRRGLGGAPWEYFKGKIEEMRFWNCALTESQIQSNMCKTMVGDEANLSAYYKFDQNALDATAGASTISLGGSPSYSVSTAFNTWLGNSIDWNSASNWGLGSVPVSTDNIGIYSGLSNYPSAGNTNLTFNHLVLGSATSASLNANLTVNGNLFLYSNLNVNGYNLSLNSSSSFTNLANIITPNLSKITTSKTFNSALAAENILNLGVEITTATSPGNVSIVKHFSPISAFTGHSGIGTYFEITPANNSNLNATLVYHYNESELNGNTEANLRLFKSSDNGVTWTNQGGVVNTTTNTISLSSIGSFSFWTAAEDGTILPIELIDFAADCSNKEALKVSWSTLSEQNNSHFVVQLSCDGVRFFDVQRVEAVGNSTTLQSYSTTINYILNQEYIRLQQVDFNGNTSFSKVLTLRCKSNKDALLLFPNPAKNILQLQSTTDDVVYIYDQMGSLKLQQNVCVGVTSIDLHEFAAGIYFLRLNLASKKFIKL